MHAPSRRRAAAALVAGVAAAHAWLLGAPGAVPPPATPAAATPQSPARAPAVQLLARTSPVSPGAPAEAAEPSPAAALAAGPAAAPARPAAPAPPAAVAALAPPPAGALSAPPGAPARARAGTAEPEAEAVPPAGGIAVPVYATRLPAPVQLHFELQRDGVAGQARLRWQREGTQYALSLQGDLAGRAVPGLSSQGLLDAHGVAPVRHAEWRRAREVRAANFQRDTERITFSGPQVEHALRPGVQDRLSWMIQLPAVIEADPALGRTGARVTLWVVGTRGDAEPWHFEVQGREALDLPAGPVADALHLRREPARPYDLRVDVWLDPARSHLPVRVRLATVPDSRSSEWRLASAEAD